MDLIILLTCWIWIPLIPLRIVLHAAISFWRRLKDHSIWVILPYWIILDLIVYQESVTLLSLKFSPLPGGTWVGIFFIVSALFIYIWTIQTLGLSTLFLRPEMNPEKIKVSLVATGPYRWVRHPFYLLDWLILLGIALFTSSWLVLVLLIASILTVPFVTIYEERELVERFGDEYRQYQKQVPRLIPRWR